MKNKAIICDLDGTLITNDCWNGEYETFYDHIKEGRPTRWCSTLLKCLSWQNIKIIFITARDQKCNSITRFQLDSWFDFPYELYMRKDGDLREDYIIKEEYLKEILNRFDILFCIDDNMKNCEMFKEYIPTLKIL